MKINQFLLFRIRGNNMMKNRWLIALSAIAIHLSIGGAYAYSVYKTSYS